MATAVAVKRIVRQVRSGAVLISLGHSGATIRRHF
jgi:hypothetical protein